MGETARVGGSTDSKSKEANKLSSSAMADEVTEAAAASAFARHFEITSSLERTSSG